MDIALVETGNGGDIVVIGKDLATVESIENMAYIACFGGNVGFPYRKVDPKEERMFWWGNDFMENDPSQQITSLLEDKLRTTPLTSSGRVAIEQTMYADLQFMLDFVDKIVVDVRIISDDILGILLTIYMGQETIIKTIKYSKKIDGDFVFDDFNDDFHTSQ